jgi:hypothetical protein
MKTGGKMPKSSIPLHPDFHPVQGHSKFILILLIRSSGFALMSLLYSCNPAHISEKQSVPNAAIVKTEMPPEMDVWKKSVIHLEGAADIETVRRRIRSSESDAREINEDRYWGTSLFLIHNGRHYLVTPRHVVHDTLQAGRYLREAEDELSPSWSTEFRDSHTQSARDEAETCIFNLLYRVPSLEEFQNDMPQGIPEFLIGLGDGPYNQRSYTFSDPEINLAVISLDPRHTAFAERLLSAGYVPVSTDKIMDRPSREGAEIYSVGYPLMPALFDRLDVEFSERLWNIGFISISTFTFGRVVSLHAEAPYFLCEMNMDSRMACGPVIENERIVGIINSHAKSIQEESHRIKALKGGFIKSLIKRHIEKDGAVE